MTLGEGGSVIHLLGHYYVADNLRNLRIETTRDVIVQYSIVGSFMLRHRAYLWDQNVCV